MADFTNFRDRLNKKGIETGNQLAQSLLDEAGIAALPGSDFGLEENALVLRLAMVDFNGKNVLEACNKLGEKDINEAFMLENLTKTYRAPNKIVEWLCHS